MLKAAIRAITPPAIYTAAHRIKSRFNPPAPLAPGAPAIQWSIAEQWRDGYATLDRGYQATAARRLRDALDRDGLAGASDRADARAFALAFAYAIARAGAGRERVSILDFGGGLGNYSLIAERAAGGKAIDYCVVEFAQSCEIGREIFPAVRFAETCPDEPFDLVFASGSIQYVRDWRTQLAALAGRARPWLFLSRLPLLAGTPTTLVEQRSPPIVTTSWLFHEAEIVAATTSLGFALVEQFTFADEFVEIAGLAERPRVRGLLFRR